MIVRCPECDKKLKVADDGAARKVRCPGCSATVPIPARADEPKDEPAPKRRRAARPRDDESEEPPGGGMRCAKCRSHALEALPANAYSRHPGYVCTECDTVMRMPGSTAACVFIVVLGVFGVLLSLVLLFVAVTQGALLVRGLTGAGTLAVMGIGVAGWGFQQLRRPTPLDAPPQPSRLWLWILVPLLLLLLLGGAVFGFFYMLHEM